MAKLFRQSWPVGILCAGLLMLPFPIVGPVPYWRTFFAWAAFVPLLWTILSPGSLSRPYLLLRASLAAYVMGVLWYVGNCYWIYQTMLFYGGLPPLISAGILALFSLILGLYFAAFGFSIAWIGKTLGKTRLGPHFALAAAPFLWAALELLSSHLTKVPWDLLGYSQIDNFLLTALAPFTGVYGLSFVLMAGNALLAYCLLRAPARRALWGFVGVLLLILLLQNGNHFAPPPAPVEATAVLVQPNLDVNQDNRWPAPEYQWHVANFIGLSGHACGPYLAGMPQLNAYLVTPDCPQASSPPGLIAWPESPAPFYDKDPRFLRALRTVALNEHAPVVAGNIALDPHAMYNSALFIGPDGAVLGRYDKVHLVPWGEYVPFKEFFSFAKSLTQQAGDMTHGWRRMTFTTGGHTFGVFICYEEIFGDEIRIFVRHGAQVLVNLSDDGWYGDTCAPWQTLNMARMRAVENRRWLLRDTNTGLTTVIDPYGRLTASVPRHALTSLAAGYGYRSDLTFYTRHGDVFAGLCGIISLVLLAATLWVVPRGRKA